MTKILLKHVEDNKEDLFKKWTMQWSFAVQKKDETQLYIQD